MSSGKMSIHEFTINRNLSHLVSHDKYRNKLTLANANYNQKISKALMTINREMPAKKSQFSIKLKKSI